MLLRFIYTLTIYMSLKWFMKVISDVCMYTQYHVFLLEANATYTYHIKAVKFELFIIYKC